MFYFSERKKSLSWLNIFLFVFCCSFFLSREVVAAGNCKDIGGQCVDSPSDCPEDYEVDSLTTCLGDGGTVCCVRKKTTPTPTPTPTTTVCQYDCVPAENCSVTASGTCGTGVCCQTQSNSSTECSKKGGSCYPISTSCSGGTKNELSYSCNENQRCCKKTVNTCEDNGGTCVANTTSCDKILTYSCGDGGGTCCDTGSKKNSSTGSGSWQDGLTKANQAANLPDSEVDVILSKITSYIFSLITLIGVLFFVLTGIKYLSAGSTGSAEKSKLGIQHLILGVTIGLSGYIIIKFVDYILGG